MWLPKQAIAVHLVGQLQADSLPRLEAEVQGGQIGALLPGLGSSEGLSHLLGFSLAPEITYVVRQRGCEVSCTRPLPASACLGSWLPCLLQLRDPAAFAQLAMDQHPL